MFRQLDLLIAAQGVVTKAELERREKASGITIAMQGLLADVELRPLVGPATSHTYDWMHTYLSNGICSVEIYNCVQACKDNGFNDIFPTMQEYCKSTWCFPHEHSAEGKQVHTLFCKEREAASKEHWQSSASETLTAYPLIRHFAEQIMSVVFLTCKSMWHHWCFPSGF